MQVLYSLAFLFTLYSRVHAGANKAAIPETFDMAGGERGKRRRKIVETAFGEFAMECFSACSGHTRNVC